jgi:hypothetical protein
MVAVTFTLFVTLSGGAEQRWKSYSRVEECLEVAKIITHHRDYITARCVREELAEPKQDTPKKEQI